MTTTINLTTLAGQARLPYRAGPWFMPLGKGRALGLRLAKDGSLPTWIARHLPEGESGYRFQSLSDYAHLPAADRFGAAKLDAEAWFGRADLTGVHVAVTVGEACRSYAKGRDDTEVRFKRLIYSDPVASIRLDRLNAGQMRAWRERMEAMPMERREGERSLASINRDVCRLRAALNVAKANGWVATDAAWAEPLKGNEGVVYRRRRYLTRDERKRLLDAVPQAERAFFTALASLPIRPGALSEIRADDYDPRTKSVRIGIDKKHAPRSIALPPAMASLFAEQARGKLPMAFMFARANGKPWCRYSWRETVNSAVAAAGLPADVNAYCLRHSAFSDLIEGGMDLASVATIGATSIKVLASHYHHLNAATARDHLARLALG